MILSIQPLHRQERCLRQRGQVPPRAPHPPRPRLLLVAALLEPLPPAAARRHPGTQLPAVQVRPAARAALHPRLGRVG
jgi:hypothetical protein